AEPLCTSAEPLCTGAEHLCTGAETLCTGAETLCTGAETLCTSAEPLAARRRQAREGRSSSIISAAPHSARCPPAHRARIALPHGMRAPGHGSVRGPWPSQVAAIALRQRPVASPLPLCERSRQAFANGDVSEA